MPGSILKLKRIAETAQIQRICTLSARLLSVSQEIRTPATDP